MGQQRVGEPHAIAVNREDAFSFSLFE